MPTHNVIIRFPECARVRCSLLYLSFTLILSVAANSCIYIPVKSPAYKSAAVGAAGSNAPLQVGTSTRADVIARFGRPTYNTEHDEAIGYLNSTKIGHATGLLLGPCSTPYLGSADQYETDDLWLQFDAQGVLKRFAVHRGNSKEQESWILFCTRVPDKPRADQLYLPDKDEGYKPTADR